MTNIELKQLIKDTAAEITKLKATRKEAWCGYVSGLKELQYKFRHHHIAASLLRGRTIEQIESKVDLENNPRNMDYVKRIMGDIVFVKKEKEEEKV